MQRSQQLKAPIDLTGFIQPGDTILWGQGSSEPQTLSGALIAQRKAFHGSTVFMGLSTADTVHAEHADHLSFASYCGLGHNRQLHQAGVLDIMPCHYSQLPNLIEQGLIGSDVVFLHLSQPGPDGRHSLGISHDYLLAAARKARVVIAEVNDQMPWTPGSNVLESLHIDAMVNSSRPLPELHAPAIGDIERRIAQHAAAFINDGDTLETGIGTIPNAIMAALANHRDLGIHTGMAGDGILDLINADVITNTRKPIDCGMTTVGILLGTRQLYAFAHENRSLNLQPASYTHNIATLSQLNNFVAINSAIEVDLTGQVNAEMLGQHYIGAVGGQTDFIRGTQAAKNGRSIIAMPSTARGGTISRISTKLNGATVTTPRSDADIFITEWGAAQLKGQPLKERMQRMIEIAHPDFREQLARNAFNLAKD